MKQYNMWITSVKPLPLAPLQERETVSPSFTITESLYIVMNGAQYRRTQRVR